MKNIPPDNASMAMIFRSHLLLGLIGTIAFAAMSAACGDASTAEAEDVESIEWNVTVRKAVQFNDSLRGISTDRSFEHRCGCCVKQSICQCAREGLRLSRA